MLLLLALLLGAQLSSAQTSTNFTADLRTVKLRRDSAGNPIVVTLTSFGDPNGPAAAVASTGDDAVNHRGAAHHHRALFSGSKHDARRSSRVLAEGFGSATVPAKTALSFTGLTSYEHRFADNGNQSTGPEPPQPAVCVGRGFVLEAANAVLRVYDASSATPLTAPISLNQFYSYPSLQNRQSGEFGPLVVTPSCLFDHDTQKWFLVAGSFSRNRQSGDLAGAYYINIAVSSSEDPTGSWMFYRVPVQNDGTEGTPNHGCVADGGAPGPCYADYVQLGANADGIYVVYNEFDLFGPNFYGANILALSKRRLASKKRVVSFLQFQTTNAPSLGEGSLAPCYTLAPAHSPPLATTHSVQYFLSTDIGSIPSPGVLFWKLSHTAQLSRANLAATSLKLRATLVQVSSTIDGPPPADQPARGPWPLGQCANKAQCATANLQLAAAADPPETRGALDGGQPTMRSAYFAAGKVWGSYGTAAASGGSTVASIGWLAIDPSTSSITNQGVVAAPDGHVVASAFAVNSQGRGALGFTLVGADRFPSAAYAAFDGTGFGEIVVVGAGKGLQDGKTEYASTAAGNPPRWGDATGVAVDEDGSIWLASEFIDQSCTLAEFVTKPSTSTDCPQFSCGCTRYLLTNWATRVTKVQFD